MKFEGSIYNLNSNSEDNKNEIPEESLKDRGKALREKAIDAIDTTIGGIAKGASTTKEGIAKGAEIIAETPEWVLDKTGEGLGVVAESMDRAREKFTSVRKRFFGSLRKLAVKGRDTAVAGASMAVGAGIEGYDFLKDKINETAQKGLDWTSYAIKTSEDWVDGRYQDIKGKFIEKATLIQEKAHDYSEEFKQRVDSAKAWRNVTLEAYRSLKDRHDEEKFRVIAERLATENAMLRKKIGDIESIAKLSSNIENI